MSANNYILIAADNTVTMRDMDTGLAFDSYTKQLPTLDEAVRYAQDIMDEELVEYGIDFERRATAALSPQTEPQSAASTNANLARKDTSR